MKLLTRSKDTRNNELITPRQFYAIDYIERYIDNVKFEGTTKLSASNFIGEYLQTAKNKEREYLDELPDFGELY